MERHCDFCCHCHVVYAEAENGCYFCGQPLVALGEAELTEMSKKGQWLAFCSLGRQFCDPRRTLLVGRDDPYTAFLFRSNQSVAERHARLTAQGECLIALQDLESGRDTFIRAEEQRDGEHWHKLEPGEEVQLASGSWFRLGRDSLCRSWNRWRANRQNFQIEKAQGPIPLREESVYLGEGCEIKWQEGRHLLRNIGDSLVVHNSSAAIVAFLEEGDRLCIDGRSYEYSRERLSPVSPLIPPRIELHDISLRQRLQIAQLNIDSGEFTAVLGESGSGKSTLIKLITGWLQPTSGQLCIIPPQPVVYIPQYDIVYDNLTVAQTLFYTLVLVSDSRQSRADLQRRVTQLLKQMGLLAVANKKNSRLSGGQRKRVNIANELLKGEVSLVVLDEPTSGLDLANDYRIMALLQRLSRQGRTVVCITHHLANMRLFDKIVVLEKDVEKGIGTVREANPETPAEIAYRYECPMAEPNSYDIFHSESANDSSSAVAPRLLPPFSTVCQWQWWILLARRFNEFFHPSRSWMKFLSMLVLIPLFIGGAIAIACVASKVHKVLFLCSVASFWLGMSIAAPELSQGRYRIFLHEKKNGVRALPYCLALLLFFTFVSGLQSGVLLTSPLLVNEHLQQPQPLKKHLFDLDSTAYSISDDLITTLDKGEVAVLLQRARQQLAKNGCVLSEKLRIDLKQRGKNWQLIDLVASKSYQIRNDKGEIAISGTVDRAVPIDKNSESIAALDEGNAPQEIVRLLENWQGVEGDLQIQIVVSGKEWIVADQLQRYKITTREKHLDIWFPGVESQLALLENAMIKALDAGKLETIATFAEAGISTHASVFTRRKGRSWSIEDGSKRYIAYNDEGILRVFYDYCDDVDDRQLITALDSQKMVDYLQQAFRENGIDVEPEVEIIAPSRQWLIAGQYIAKADTWHMLRVYRQLSTGYTFALYFLIVWGMGLAGAICGLNLSIVDAHSRGKLPTTVSVPCLTVIQLIFSAMVMIPGDLQSYYQPWFTGDGQLRDWLYWLTFSRYPDMAITQLVDENPAYYIDSAFYANMAFFSVLALAIPAALLLVSLRFVRERE